MLLCVFLILTAYYVLKTAREGLILAGGTFGLGGDEMKIYASGAMALLLVVVVPAYSALANRVRRIRLIGVSYGIVMACLVAFAILGRAGVPIGLPFFIWLGLVNVFLVAQFWSYANDIYSEEQGKRLFAIIAIGGSLGAIVGPYVSKLADTFSLLIVAAVMLVGTLVLFLTIERLHRNQPAQKNAEHADKPVGGAGGFALVMRDRYLLMIAGLLLVANLVNTTGEFILSNAVREHAMAMSSDEGVRRELIKNFYGDFFLIVNIVGFVIQAFLVSRIINKVGVRWALFVLPVVALGAYAVIGIVGGLALIRAGKIAENSLDYSLQNTVRQALFLPTDRAVKYKAKATIDTFFVRLGDTISAVVVGVGLHKLGFGGHELAFVNVGLVVVWLALTVGIAHRYAAISTDERERGSKQPSKSSRLKPAHSGAL